MATNTFRPTRVQSRQRISFDKMIVHGVLIAISILFIFPLLLIISTSFSNEQAITTTGYAILPKQFTIFAYSYILSDPSQILNAYGVTTIVTVTGTALGLLIMSLLAYALSRRDFRFRRPLSFYVLFTLLFNGGLVPWYILITQYLHLKDNILVLILPYLVIPWFVLILRTYFAGLPSEVIEAAKLDGAGEWRIYFQIVVPLSTPVLATIGLFLMLLYWNDWWLSLLFINNPNLVSLQYLLYRLQTNIDFLAASPMSTGMSIPANSVRMAMAVLAVGPMALAFLFAQRYFVRGITLGSFK